MTNLVFPTSPYTAVTLTASGKATLNSAVVYPLNPSR